jgi:hypothetical protein
MKRIIICEGKTDAILVGYFLIKVYGWLYSRDRRLPALPFEKQNESLCWYSKPNAPGFEVAVWGAGGIDRVPEKLARIVERTKAEHVPENRFERLVVLIDRDTRTVEEVRNLVEGWYRDAGIELGQGVTIGQWSPGAIQLGKTPPEAHSVRLLPIVLPATREGCLEVFLADSLRSVGDTDRMIVDGCREFVDTVPDEPYLSEARFRPKATIGAVLSIMSPDWVFGDLDEKLTSVEWEKIEDAHAAYAQLADL